MPALQKRADYKVTRFCLAQTFWCFRPINPSVYTSFWSHKNILNSFFKSKSPLPSNPGSFPVFLISQYDISSVAGPPEISLFLISLSLNLDLSLSLDFPICSVCLTYSRFLALISITLCLTSPIILCILIGPMLAALCSHTVAGMVLFWSYQTPVFSRKGLSFVF